MVELRAVAEQKTDPPTPGVEFLLKSEAEARRVATPGELVFLIANDAMRLARARQVFVIAVKGRRHRVEAVSSVGRVERESPRIRWIESMVGVLGADAGLAERRDFVLPAYSPPGDEEHKSYPFRFFLWLPLKLRDNHVFAGMLLAREAPWLEQDVVIAVRLAETYAHAWAALTGPRRLAWRPKLKPLAAILLLSAIASTFIPVSLSVLAPAEVTAIAPHVVAAPLDGVIERILVSPNQPVKEGEPLVQLSEMSLRNELSVAEQNIRVAEANLKKISQGALADPKMRAELAVANSELALAAAKRDYAKDMLERTLLLAPIAGIAVYTDPRDWSGRPVTTGERIMEIADPDKLELRVDVAIADAIAVKAGAKVRAFLDSDPLRPLDASVRSVSFEAQMIENNTLAYRIYATLHQPRAGTRLGIRGTAQVYGDKVPLAYYLFRRPIAAVRQWLGL
jgi:multidrug efflux pump subunit AcrA (membrane-fusion protein)